MPTEVHLFRMKQSSVSSKSDFINDSWLQVNKDSSWNMFARASLREKGVEAVISTSNGLVRWHLAIRLDTFKSEI